MEKTFIQRFFGHLHTINTHKNKVMCLCFRCGMIKQGLLHDLSKYSFEEFFPSVKFFQGYRSPISYEKELYGYSPCWLHHKGRNKHHWEYWTDRIGERLIAIEMPFNYMLESTLDKISASKVYKKEAYTNASPYEFFINSKEIKTMHENNARQILGLLSYLKDNGEKKAVKYYRSLYFKWKKDKKFTI